ncbi:MAG: FAD-dependent oxidoreductase [Deltaproteobacteria bacterium]|nr:FAD-dependent oxidoreductase [Deltaproteobacteria bacterium]
MSKQRLVVIGGVAAGMSAASQAKRRKPDLEVVVFEKGPWVSYGACGMPYNIQDPSRRIEDLVVITPERFRSERGIDVRTQSEVIELDITRRVCTVRQAAGESRVEYDQLVMATGCKPLNPPFSGLFLAGVFFLHTLVDAERIKRYLNDNSLEQAVVIGGGHIGLEMADVLCARGLQVTLLKRSDALPPGYPEEISSIVRAEFERYGVQLQPGTQVLGFEGDSRVRKVKTTAGSLPADLVIVATGVEPQVGLAVQAGLRLGDSGAIEVDRHMRTSIDGVFAAGDCAEAFDLLAGQGKFIPRGTTANKQGRIAGANVVGADKLFKGVMGTSVTKVFGLAVGHTGLLDQPARQAGFDPVAAFIKARTRAHSYPGAKDIAVRLVFERANGRILGAQLAGGEGVAKRLDVIVAALHANWTVEDLAACDLSYAPPFAPVWDPILVAANVACKKGGWG